MSTTTESERTGPDTVARTTPVADVATGGLPARSPRWVARTVRLRTAVARPDAVAVASIVVLAVVVLAGVFAPWISPYPADGASATHPNEALLPPSAAHWFGTDVVGRDVLTRVIFGARTSVLIVIGVLIGSAVVGVTLGTIAGYLGGVAKQIIMRVTDVFLAFPTLLLTVVLVSIMQAGLVTVIVALSIAWWPWYARTAAAMAASVRSRGYVEAATCLGEPWHKIVFSHVLPNSLPPVIVQLSLDAGTIILAVASLSYLGIGVKEPTAEWGLMIFQGQSYLNAQWWLAVVPGVVVLLTAFAFSVLGERLRLRIAEGRGA
ncbi:ABC transporter permease [Plantibacter flavus]|uniref:ABC transporter permease n=1 Tax=Plantibacter flavus TaxID=150123 RepID=UPI003F18A636